MQQQRRAQLQAQNIWLHNEVASTMPRMFARDLSGYEMTSSDSQADDRVVLGDFVTFRSWSGPRSVPPMHTWREAESSLSG